MYRIETKIKTESAEFKENKTHYLEQLAIFKERIERVKQGGPPKALEKHKSRGKLTARERLDKLFDPNTPFLEFSQLAAFDLYDKQASAAGIITGVGVVHGKEVLVVAKEIHEVTQ